MEVDSYVITYTEVSNNPTNLQATDITDTTTTLTWEAPVTDLEVDSYVITYTEVPNNPTNLQATDITDTTTTLTWDAPVTDLEVDSYVITYTEVSNNPTNLQATDITDTTTTLTWEAPVTDLEVDSYVITYTEVPNNPPTNLQATTTSITNPPTNLQATSITDTTTTLTWDAPVTYLEVDSYVITYTEVSANPPTNLQATDITDTTTTLTWDPPVTEFNYKELSVTPVKPQSGLTAATQYTMGASGQTGTSFLSDILVDLGINKINPGPLEIYMYAYSLTSDVELSIQGQLYYNNGSGLTGLFITSPLIIEPSTIPVLYTFTGQIRDTYDLVVDYPEARLQIDVSLKNTNGTSGATAYIGYEMPTAYSFLITTLPLLGPTGPTGPPATNLWGQDSNRLTPTNSRTYVEIEGADRDGYALVIPNSRSIYVDGNIDLGGNLSANNNIYVTNQLSSAYSSEGNYSWTIDNAGTITGVKLVQTSDYRIKENVQPLSKTSYTIDNLNPVRYFNTLTKNEDIGFIAHELQEHYPFLVTGEKDGPTYQHVNYLPIISLLTNEIQQLKKDMQHLKNEIIDIKHDL